MQLLESNEVKTVNAGARSKMPLDQHASGGAAPRKNRYG